MQREEPALSVLDVGTGLVKALVVAPGPPVSVLGAAAAELPSDPAQSAGAQAGLVAACEQALEAAEDAAGVVPRRVAIGLDGQHGIVVTATGETRRSRPSAVISPEEVALLLARLQREALATARRRWQTERAGSDPLVPVNAAVLRASAGGRVVADPTGLAGAWLELALVSAFAGSEPVGRARALAEQLDLDLAALFVSSYALGACLAVGRDGRGVVVDVGAEATSVVLADGGWVAGAGTLPLGGRGLEARLAAELGLSQDEARAAVAAHTLGGGTGLSAALHRAVRRLAEHHAEVWLDGVELLCAELAQEGTLPPRILLCGGAAGLPELRRGLAEPSWHAALPFERPPAVRLLAPADVPHVNDHTLALPALQAVPALCLAAMAAGACAPPTRLDHLLETG
jgi:hypothetical protein